MYDNKINHRGLKLHSFKTKMHVKGVLVQKSLLCIMKIWKNHNMTFLKVNESKQKHNGVYKLRHVYFIQ